MKRFLISVGLLLVLLVSIPFWVVLAETAGSSSSSSNSCKWVELNTDIWNYVGIKNGCISIEEMEMKKWASLFGNTLAGLGKFIVQILVLVAFWLVIFGGVMIASSGAYEEWYTKGKAMIMKAIVGIILLGLMGTILYWLNPNFFKI